MAIYQIQEEKEVAASLAEVWDFISSPANLKEITPDYMGFEITTPGLMISYKVRPVLGIQMNWLTEITQVREPNYFVDEQRSGQLNLITSLLRSLGKLAWESEGFADPAGSNLDLPLRIGMVDQFLMARA